MPVKPKKVSQVFVTKNGGKAKDTNAARNNSFRAEIPDAAATSATAKPIAQASAVALDATSMELERRIQFISAKRPPSKTRRFHRNWPAYCSNRFAASLPESRRYRFPRSRRVFARSGDYHFGAGKGRNVRRCQDA